MAEPALRARVELQGRNIRFIIEVDNVELPEGLNIAAFVAVGGAITLDVLHGLTFLTPLIREVINTVFGGDGQDGPDIGTGSLHVLLRCFTEDRFLEVLSDYESGRIKERLQKEFLKYGFKVEGLKVEIENMEEVNKIKEAINKRPRIIVQGGMYRLMPPDKKNEYIRATKESAKKGYAKLMEGGTAVDAVEAAVRVLEDDENFNAGRGSLLNDDCEVECDAMIMEGHTLNNGAVISGRRFLNPVSLAKEIMYKSPHCALSGDGALQFGQGENFPICDPKELISEQARERVKVSKENYMEWVKYFYEGKPAGEETHDSVSAIAMDANGDLACAMSTGGVAGKSKGRVSDAPMIGCGAYANKTGAATVTGYGESIIKVTLAREVVYNMENGQDAQESAENGLKKMKELVNARGGVITIDKDGNFGKDFTTNLMVWASIKDNNLEFGMEKKEVKRERLV